MHILTEMTSLLQFQYNVVQIL